MDLAFPSVCSNLKYLTLPMGILPQAIFSDGLVCIMTVCYLIAATVKIQRKMTHRCSYLLAGLPFSMY